jgi:hypothetical protein
MSQAFLADRSDWNHQESEANGFCSILARWSASPSWLALIERSWILTSREALVLVARLPPKMHHVVRRGSQFFGDSITSTCARSRRHFHTSQWSVYHGVSNGLAVRPVTASYPTPTTLEPQIEISEASLLADRSSTCMLCHTIEAFQDSRRPRFVPFS